MYAVVKTGGKQYRVAKDDKILVEHIDAEEGQTITLDKVMMLGDGDKVTIGAPVVENASVEAEVLSQTRGPKIIIFRRKRRKNHRRIQGHRQDLTLLKITDISSSGKRPPLQNRQPRKLKPRSLKQRSQLPRKQRQKRQRHQKLRQRNQPLKKQLQRKKQSKEESKLWHIKRQAEAHEMVAIQPVAVLALKNSAARQ